MIPRRTWLILILAAVTVAVLATPLLGEDEPFLGLWSSPPGNRVEDSFLYRAVLRYRARATLRSAGMLPEVFRAREDSLRLRSDRLEDFIVLQDSLGLGWMPPSWLRPPTLSDVTKQITVDIDSSRVETATLLRGSPVARPIRGAMAQYLEDMTSGNYHSIWQREAQDGLSRIESGSQAGTGLVKIALPVNMPKSLQGFLGGGRPNLQVRGSERITFAGTSRWFPHQPVTEFQGKQSKFPQLEMKQELNLRLTGNIGDKVSVDVDQSSQATTPLANNIKIHYKGYADEVVQRVDLGNTSLSLPGTQYVTYSGQQQGLFGINAQALVGDVEVTGILSKQEGKNDTRTLTKGAEIRTFTIDDYQYKQGKFFFLTDPDGPPMTADRVGALVDGSVEVWIDDRNGNNDIEQGATPTYVTLDGLVNTAADSIRAGRAAFGKFVRLTVGDDYTVQNDVYVGYPVLILSDTQVLDSQMSKAMAVRYSTSKGNVGGSISPDTLVLKLIRPAADMGGTRPTDLTQGIFGAAARLELRNVYDLGSNLSPDGLVVRIRRKATQGGVTNPDRIGNHTFLEIVGLDLYTESGESRIPGADGKIDRSRISYDSGYVMFPELQPFAPTAKDEDRRIGFPYPPETLIDKAPEIYRRDYWTDFDANQLSKYQFEVTARSAVSTITLNAFNILQGSEVVTAGGRTLSKDRDYTIDYDTGEIQILDAAQVQETDEIRVSYSYVPFGAGAQKTLMGTAFRFRPQSSRLGLSTTWFYEGRGAPGAEGQRPRLGQEPTRTVVGEFAANYKSDSWFLTSLVDALPGVKTSQKSNFSVDGGIGLSFPNPNTRNQLYVDDFEGAKDVFTVQMNRTAWRPAGVPRGAPGNTPLSRLDHRGECWWYSPRSAVKEGDLQPTSASKGGLADTEKDNNRQIMELHYFPRMVGTVSADSSWYALVEPLSQRGMDLTRAQFLDVWVNDFIPYSHRAERKGTIHIDIGVVSENAVWRKVQPAKIMTDPLAWEGADSLLALKLDSEDANHDGQLDLPGTGQGEDVGLDGIPDTREQGYDASMNPDPANDDWSFDEGKDEGLRDLGAISEPGVREKLDIFSKINGTERNGRLDTEDMNGNQILDTDESYFSFKIDLSDTTNIEFESARAPDQDSKYAPFTRGWRRIRVPLPEFDQAIESPSWDQVRHLRLWLSGFDQEVRLQIGGIEVTGNRWLKGRIRDAVGRDVPDSALVANGEDFFPAVLNNKDNSTSEYSPPFTPRRTQNVDEREQSLTLEMRNFQPGHQATVYRSFASAQDFASLYRAIEFYTNRKIRLGPDPDSLFLFVRMARDAATEERNYYEYRVLIREGWNLRTIDMTELSRIPIVAQGDSIVVEDLGDGTRIMRKGNPSLTSIQRIAFGLINRGSSPIQWGNVWIDELRLVSVKRDAGIASRFTFAASLADLGNVNLNFQRQDANFLRIGSDRGSGTTRTGIGASSRFNLDKFIEGTGLKIPVSLTLNSDRQVPKFRTNSDLVLKRATDRDISQTQSKDLSFTIQRSRSTNPILRYSIDAVSLSGRFGSNVTNTPDVHDTTFTRSGSVQYTLPLQGGPPIRLYRKTTLRLLPTNLSLNVTGSKQKEVEHRRQDGDLSKPYIESRNQESLTSGMTWSTGLRPVDAISYTFDQGRDLLLRDSYGRLVEQPRLLGVPIGKEVSRRHQLTANQQIRLFNGALVPKAAWTGSFDGRFNSLQTGGGVTDRSNSFNNSSTTTFSGSIPTDRFLRKFLSGMSRGGKSKEESDSNDQGDIVRPGDYEKPGEPDTTGIPPVRTPPPQRGPGGGGMTNLFSMGAIVASYTIGSTSSLGLVSGEPSIAYQLGLSRAVGHRVTQFSTFNPNRSTGDRKDLSVSTDLKILSEIAIRTSFQRSENNSSTNGGGSKTKTLHFPDLDIDWGRIHRRLGLEKVAKDIKATTHYTRETRETGTNTAPKDRSETSVSFRPFLNLDATLHNGMSSRLTSTYTSTRQEQFGVTHNVTISRSRAIQLNVKRTLTLNRMVTNPLTKKKSKVSSKLDMSVTLDLGDDRRQSGAAGNLIVLEDRAKIALSTTGGYNITKNVTGNAGLTFGQDSDRKNKTRTARYISVSVSAAFNF